MQNNYNRVADEYYDSTAHPTCNNLRDATLFGLKKMQSKFLRGDKFCEVGCGKSMLREIVQDSNTNIYGIDKYPNMLAYSRYQSLKLIQGDVYLLPFCENLFDGVFGSLADPYNTLYFYREAFRVLKNDRYLLYSVPDYSWVNSYRTDENITHQTAKIVMADSEEIHVTSYVYEYNEQVERLQQAGFLDVEVLRVSIEDSIPAYERSKRLLNQNGQLMSKDIVTLYLARK